MCVYVQHTYSVKKNFISTTKSNNNAKKCESLDEIKKTYNFYMQQLMYIYVFCTFSLSM